MNSWIFLVPENFQNFEYIDCIHINTPIWGCEWILMWSSNVLKIFNNLWYWQNSGIHVNAPNAFKIFKILACWQNSGIHVNAPNLLKMVGYWRSVDIDVSGCYEAQSLDTRVMDIITSLVCLNFEPFMWTHTCQSWKLNSTIQLFNYPGEGRGRSWRVKGYGG